MAEEKNKRLSDSDIPAYLQEVATGNGKYYITNKDLLPEVIKCKEQGFVSDRLAKMLMLMTRMLAKKYCYAGYPFKEDMISEALLNLTKNALKFDPEVSNNPFAYYTTAIKRSFHQVIRSEKTTFYIRDTLLVKQGLNPSYNYEDNPIYKKVNGIEDDDKSETEKVEQKKEERLESVEDSVSIFDENHEIVIEDEEDNFEIDDDDGEDVDDHFEY